MTRRALALFLTFLLPVLLAACGGGAPGASAAMFSDSSWTTSYFDPPGVLVVGSPTMTELANAAGPVHVIDHSANGLQLAELLRGGPVLMGAAVGQTVQPLTLQLGSELARYVVFGLGHVEALFTDTTPSEFAATAREAVVAVRAAGKTPILLGLIRFAPSQLITPTMIARRDAFDAVLARVAAEEGVPFVDQGAARFDGPADVRPDLLHPGAAYNQRRAALVAQRLAQITGAMQ
ncbi:GDSL-type esterase/lipase family protein [Aquabacterium sp.]|uniref:GDSL-type esterase/lipase family protein n=1 Tax=Aquabacterium sp. TaxID=1872578 RepID=UPI0025B7F8F6|nr:GDSL-type esterase/lipase family protein [Aquabacterium sp.]